MIMTEQIGYLKRFVKQHSEAADMFRKVLQIAWILEDKEMERRAYSHLAFEHFYMGNMSKSKYYSVRYDRGLVENENSRMKQTVTRGSSHSKMNNFK